MAKKSTIYTKTGDKGTTKLYSGQTVSKGNKQVHVLGQFDHLNSHIGVTYEKIKSISQSSWISLADRGLDYFPFDNDDLISLKAFFLVILISIVGSLYLTASFPSSMCVLLTLFYIGHRTNKWVRSKCANYKANLFVLRHLETIMFDIKNIMTLVANPVEDNRPVFVEDPSISIETYQNIMMGIPVDEKRFVENYKHVNLLFKQMIHENQQSFRQREDFFAKNFVKEKDHLVYTGPVSEETKAQLASNPDLEIKCPVEPELVSASTDNTANNNIAVELTNETAETKTESATEVPSTEYYIKSSDMIPKLRQLNNREQVDMESCFVKPETKLIKRIKEQFNETSLASLEEMIDLVDCSEEHPIRCFLYPVGSELTAQIHTVRTLCRSVELDLYSAGDSVYNIECGQDYNLLIAKYMNRLSSYLFVLSRWATIVVAKEKEIEFDEYKIKKIEKLQKN